MKFPIKNPLKNVFGLKLGAKAKISAKDRTNRRVLYTFFSAAIILVGSYFAIRYANGDRFTKNGSVQGMGLLAANSFPPGASVSVDGQLVGVTDNNAIYLAPKSYNVQIRKDGYTPWEKSLKIEAGLVNQTNAQLYRLAPSLTPLTYTGVTNLSVSPDGQKILFYTASASAKTNNGLYLLDLNNGFLSTSRDPRQIAEEASGFDLATSHFVWSPDDTQGILMSNGREVLLDVSKKNNLAALPDVAFQRKTLLSQWESTLYQRERQFFSKFPDEVIRLATTSARNIYLSPDKKKIVYTATAAAEIPNGLIPALPASDNQPETRTLQPGQTYVYDREEDKNFALTALNHLTVTAATLPAATPTATVSATHKVFLATDLDHDPLTLEASPSAFLRLQASSSAQIASNFNSFYTSLYSTGLQWFPDSKHLLLSDGNKIYLVEYDNTNLTPIYAGPFANQFVYPWPDGSKILILTSFGAATPTNLYAIELK